jgi:hypothetical protein
MNPDDSTGTFIQSILFFMALLGNLYVPKLLPSPLFMTDSMTCQIRTGIINGTNNNQRKTTLKGKDIIIVKENYK